MDKQRETYNLFVGKGERGEYIFLNEAFCHGSEFSGLTGYSFEFCTEAQMEEDEDNYLYSQSGEDLFCEYIKKSHDFDCTLSDWVEEVKNEHPNGAAYDDSYCDEPWLKEAMEYVSRQEGYDYEYSNCISGGRIFNEENVKEDYYEWYIPENLALLQKLYEKFEK